MGQSINSIHTGGGEYVASSNRKECGKMWYYVGKCGNMWTSGHQIFFKYMALDGQFYFLVLFGWMPLIPGGYHTCYESLVFHGHKQTTALSVYVKPTSAFRPIILPNIQYSGS